MATPAATLSILVNAQTRSATSSLQRLDRSARTSSTHLQNLDTRSSRLSQTLGRAGKAAVAAAAGYVGINAAQSAINTTMDLTKTTLTLHKSLGLTANTAWDLGVALKARGADATKVSMAFKTFATQMNSAATGSQSAIDKFSTLGITGKKLSTDLQNPQQMLLDVADGLKGLGTGAARTAITSQLFGRSWQALRPIMQGGSGALQSALKAVEDNGAGLGGNIQKLKDMRKAQIQAKITSIGLEVAFTTGLAPALTKLLNLFSVAVKAFRDLPTGTKQAVGALALLAGAVWLVVKAQAALDAVALVNPYVLLGVAVAAAAILIITHWNEVKHATKDALDFIKKHALLIGIALAPLTLGMSLVAAVVFKNWGKIKGAFGDGIAWIKNAWHNIGDFLSKPFGAAVGAIKGFINDIISVINTVLGPVGVHLGSVGGGGPSGVQTTHHKGTGGGVVSGKGMGHKRQRGGGIPGSGSGDKVPALLEPGEFVINKNAVAHYGPKQMEMLNASVPRFQVGGLAQKVGSSIGNAIAGGGNPLSGLPGVGSLPGWIQPAGTFVLNKVGGFITDKLASLVGGGGHQGPGGIGTYKGLAMANWVIQSLQFAASKGVAPQPTSGYRSHATNVLAGRNYTSEHEGTAYPHGAVDFGGFVDPAALVKKMAVVGATRNFKFPLLAPIGFRDDGHASGTGHQKGGLIQRLAGGGLAAYNKTYPRGGGPAIPFNVAAAIAEQAGLPGITMAQVAIGESTLHPGAVSPDGGYGLWQMTPRVQSASTVSAWNRIGSYFNPFKNAQMAKVLGQPNSGTYHGSSHVSNWNQHYHGPLLHSGASASKAPKAGKTPKAPKTPKGPSQAVLDAAQAGMDALDARNVAIGLANDLIGAGNLEALQRYQVGASQNPLLGIPAPLWPVLQALLPPAAWPTATGINLSLGKKPTTSITLGKRKLPKHLRHQGPIAHFAAGGMVPGPVGSPQAAIVHGGETIIPPGGGDTHVHVYIDGKEIQGVVKKIQRKSARGGNRPLPSAGGGM